MKALLISVSGTRKPGCGHCMVIPSVQLTYIDSYLLPICPWHCAVTEVTIFSFLEFPPKAIFNPGSMQWFFFFWWLLCTSKENWWLSVCIYHLSGKSLWPNITIMDTIKRVFENRSSSTLLEHRDSKGQIFKMNFFPSGQVFDAIIKMPFRTSTSHYQSASVQVTAPLWILSSCKCTTWEPGWEWFKHLGLCHLHGRPRMSSGLMPLAWPAPATIGI